MSRSTKIVRDQRGQTLIELLTAVFVLSLALVGALSLANSNAKNQNIGSLRLTASYLAREGVETARALRDSNWLAELPPDQWDTGLKDPNGITTCAILTQGGVSFQFVECKKDGEKNVIFDDLYRLYRTDTGMFSQSPTPEQAEGDGTAYYRKVTFTPTCLPETQEANCGLNAKIGVTVMSEVWWQYGSQTPHVTVAEQLTNWK